MACRVSENEPVMIAWLAMIVATAASATSGKTPQEGTNLKKGFPSIPGSWISSAVWPA